MTPTDVFAKTQEGIDAMLDPRAPLSASFRRLLSAVDGALTVKQLSAQLPHLSLDDMKPWFAELARLGYIRPLSGGAAPAAAAAGRFAPAHEPVEPSNYAYEGYVEMTQDPDFKATVAAVGQWMKQNTKAAAAVPDERLAQTTRMAMIEAKSTLDTINRAGFFMQPPELAAATVKAEAGAAARPRRRVLIVEDDDLQVAMLKTIVGREGHDIAVAQQREEIINALNAQPGPDVLLLDVELPDADGFTILERIKQHPTLNVMRVIMVTGRTERADIAKGVLLGADGYITKPYRPSTLRAAVMQALGEG
jgi:CheY-like chemotaxis protein